MPSLHQLSELQADFDKSHGIGRSFYVPIDASNLRELEHLVVCLVGELGEFSNILKKVVRGDVDLEEAKPALSEELADVLIYLLKISIQFDVDLEAEFLAKLKKNASRFPRFEAPDDIN